ncbi:hypothetical protein RSAG8_05651, partial [Rhizoctonia solani AG-8 WAC10335]
MCELTIAPLAIVHLVRTNPVSVGVAPPRGRSWVAELHPPHSVCNVRSALWTSCGVYILGLILAPASPEEYVVKYNSRVFGICCADDFATSRPMKFLRVERTVLSGGGQEHPAEPVNSSRPCVEVAQVGRAMSTISHSASRNLVHPCAASMPKELTGRSGGKLAVQPRKLWYLETCRLLCCLAHILHFRGICKFCTRLNLT